MVGDVAYTNVGHLVHFAVSMRKRISWLCLALCLDMISAVRVHQYDDLLQSAYVGRPGAGLLVAYCARA